MQRWVPAALRDEVVDFVIEFSHLIERPVRWVLRQLDVAPGQFHRWTKRHGTTNAHNGMMPRTHWTTAAERQAILDYHAQHPLDGYRRLSYMMLDADVVAVSPATVYRVLRLAGVLDRWSRKASLWMAIPTAMPVAIRRHDSANVVRGTDPSNLGGKVVWLGDERRRQSLYYAHLDSAVVTEGQRVRIGDTLGFVGNTGNARTTAPHLHFGIYRRGAGPIDPLAHVRQVLSVPPVVRADTTRLGRAGVTRIANATLRWAPSATSPALQQVPRASVVQIMGASANWYRVQFADGTTGYLSATAFGN